MSTGRRPTTWPGRVVRQARRATMSFHSLLRSAGVRRSAGLQARLSTAFIALILVLCGRVVAQQEDWPEFRGATGQGHSSERGLPLEWSESHNVAWKTAVRGRGWSSPVIGGGRVWITTA